MSRKHLGSQFSNTKIFKKLISEIFIIFFVGYAWTLPVNNDDATGLGDFEYLTSMDKKQGCSNPIAMRATATETAGYSSWPVHMDLHRGFWCVNSEMDNGFCENWAVELCCPKVCLID